MFTVVRIFRGIFGFACIMQILLMLPILSWAQQPNAITGNMIALVTVKVFWLTIFGALFMWLHKKANKLYILQHGIAHPSISKIVSF